MSDHSDSQSRSSSPDPNPTNAVGVEEEEEGQEDVKVTSGDNESDERVAGKKRVCTRCI